MAEPSTFGGLMDRGVHPQSYFLPSQQNLATIPIQLSLSQPNMFYRRSLPRFSTPWLNVSQTAGIHQPASIQDFVETQDVISSTDDHTGEASLRSDLVTSELRDLGLSNAETETTATGLTYEASSLSPHAQITEGSSFNEVTDGIKMTRVPHYNWETSDLQTIPPSSGLSIEISASSPYSSPIAVDSMQTKSVSAALILSVDLLYAVYAGDAGDAWKEHASSTRRLTSKSTPGDDSTANPTLSLAKSATAILLDSQWSEYSNTPPSWASNGQTSESNVFGLTASSAVNSVASESAADAISAMPVSKSKTIGISVGAVSAGALAILTIGFASYWFRRRRRPRRRAIGTISYPFNPRISS